MTALADPEALNVGHAPSLPTATGEVHPGELSVEQRFAVVPEWLLDSAVSDTAFRLYAVLARYGNTSGVRMPGRALLARRMRRSLDTVDRALKELSAAGILTVERRTDAGRNLTNRYHLRTLDPAADTDTSASAGTAGVAAISQGDGRTDAATRGADLQAAACGGRTDAATGGRTGAARVAAGLRPNPEIPTETPPPPTPAGTAPPAGPGHRARLGSCRGKPGGGDADRPADLTRLAAQVAQVRGGLGLASVRWSAPCLATALQFAVGVRGWPAEHAHTALLLVAADPATRSPMRLTEAGPWWDHAARPTLTRTPQEQAELDGLETVLAETDDRAALQHQARQQLTAVGEPVTRLSVARRTARLLEQQTSTAHLAVATSPAGSDRVAGAAGAAG